MRGRLKHWIRWRHLVWWWRGRGRRKRKDKPSTVTNIQTHISGDDMKNVTKTWNLPTTRTSGGPLAREDIDFTRVEMSADGGENWALLDNVLTQAEQMVFIPDLETGSYEFRFTVVDTDGRESDTVVDDTTVVPDETNPGVVTNIQTTME